VVAACSPDLDLFAWADRKAPGRADARRNVGGRHGVGYPGEGRSCGGTPSTISAPPLLTGTEAVEFLPWLKASLPVDAILSLETQVSTLAGCRTDEAAWASVIEAFVDRVLTMRWNPAGTLPFDRMGGVVERVQMGFAEEIRLIAAIRALLSGVVVSCECPAYPVRWRRRLRRIGKNRDAADSGLRSLFEADEDAGEGALFPPLGWASPGDGRSSNGACFGQMRTGCGLDRWGLFNGPACVWVWPPIDPSSGGLGNEIDMIVGGVGSREPAPSELETARTVARQILGADRLHGVPVEGWAFDVEAEVTANGKELRPGTRGKFENRPSEPWTGSHLLPNVRREASCGLVSGGARGIDRAFIEFVDRSPSESSSPEGAVQGRSLQYRSWVILPQGLGSVASFECLSECLLEGLLRPEGRLRAVSLDGAVNIDGAGCIDGAVCVDRARSENGFEDGSERLIEAEYTLREISPCNVASRSGGVRWISAFGWRAAFSGTSAMLRNRLIYAFADETIVFSCRLGAGGTWGGAISALREGRCVRVPIPQTMPVLDTGPVLHNGFVLQKGSMPTTMPVRRTVDEAPSASHSAFKALLQRGALPFPLLARENAPPLIQNDANDTSKMTDTAEALG